MTALPISFAAPMVRALLREIEAPGTGKTQTRRMVSTPPMAFSAILRDGRAWYAGDAETGHRYAKLAVRYAVGDRLYVREAVRFCLLMDGINPSQLSHGEPRKYEADGHLYEPGCLMIHPGKLRPAMFMPRWASRITLLVTEVRVQRLHEISAIDVKAEGACDLAFLPPTKADEDQAKQIFRDLWDSLNGPGAGRVTGRLDLIRACWETHTWLRKRTDL